MRAMGTRQPAMGERQPIGSRTAFNAQDLEEMGTGGAVGNTAKTILAPKKWASLANDLITRWQAGRNLDQLARILTDPETQARLVSIAGMLSEGQEARRIAMRLSAIGYSASQRPDQVKQPAQ
jgi:hypothetical protein